MQVRDIMALNVACCTLDTSLQDIAKLMVENDCGLIVVVDDQQLRKPVGVVTDRDITCRAVAKSKNPLEMAAGECMSTPVVTVLPGASIKECCSVMQIKRVRRVIVEENGTCLGIVAQADIARQAPEKDIAKVVRQLSEPIYDTSRF
jgi:CBS domain-containing protein